MLLFWRTILLLFCICGCCSVRANNLDFVSRIYLSNKKYAKNIEVKAYLVTKDQVAKIFSESNTEITQKSNKELYGQEIFLLVRCKNFGNYRSFGTLNCKFPGGGIPISIEIMMMPSYMKFFGDAVLPMYRGTVPDNENASAHKTEVITPKRGPDYLNFMSTCMKIHLL
ncbi:MAG: hypothetical protein WCF19_00400 [Chlamydiales bacterium]